MSDEAMREAARMWLNGARMFTAQNFDREGLIIILADFASSQTCLARIEGMEAAAKVADERAKAYVGVSAITSHEASQVASAIHALIEQERTKGGAE